MDTNFIFIGLIFVGLILTIKVTTEGLRQISEQKLKLTQYQSAITQCEEKAHKENQDVEQLEDMVKQQEQDFKHLSDKEKSLETRVRDLQNRLPKRPKARMSL